MTTTYSHEELTVDATTAVLPETTSRFIMECIEAIEQGTSISVRRNDGTNVGCMDYILDPTTNIIYNPRFRTVNSINREFYNGILKESYHAERPIFTTVDAVMVDLFYNNPAIDHDRHCTRDGEHISCLQKLMPAINHIADYDAFYRSKNLDLSQPCDIDAQDHVVTCFEERFNQLRTWDELISLLTYHGTKKNLTQDCKSDGEYVPCLQKILNPSNHDLQYSHHPATRKHEYITKMTQIMDANPHFGDTLTTPMFQMPNGMSGNWIEYLVESTNQRETSPLFQPAEIGIFQRVIQNGIVDLTTAQCIDKTTQSPTLCLNKILDVIESVHEDESITPDEKNARVGIYRTLLAHPTGNRFQDVQCTNRDGTTIRCIDRLMAFIEQTYHADTITLNQQSTLVTTSQLGRQFMFDLLTSPTLNLSNMQCRDTEGDRRISCLQRCINILYNDVRLNSPDLTPISKDDENEYYHMAATQPLNKPACHNGETQTTCIEYILQKYQNSHDEPDAFFDMPEHRIGLVMNAQFDKIAAPVTISSTAGPIHIDVRDIICDLISPDDFIESNLDIEDAHKQMKALGTCKCQVDANGDPLDGKAQRKCHDELCFDLMEVADGTDYDKKWVGDIIEQGDGLETRDDPANLCGVYDIKYITARDDAKIREYIWNTTQYFKILNNQLSKTPMTTRRNVETIVKLQFNEPTVDKTGVFHDDASVTATYHEKHTFRVIDTKTVKLSRLHKIPEVKALLKKNPSLETKLHRIVTQKPSHTEQNLKLVISNRPYDLMRASSCQAWMSCFNLYDGCHNNTIHTLIDYGAYIAYVTDDEWSPTWYSRAYLIPADEESTCFMIQPAYGLPDYKRITIDAVKTLLHTRGCNLEKCRSRFPYGVSHYLWTDDLKVTDIDYDSMRDDAFELCLEDECARDQLHKDLVENEFEYYTTDNRDQYLEFYNEELEDLRDDRFDPEIHESTDDVELSKFDYERADEIARDRLYEWIYIDSDTFDEANHNRCDYDYDDYMDELDEDEYDMNDGELLEGYDEWIDTSTVEIITAADYNALMNSRGDFINTKHRYLKGDHPMDGQ